MEEIYNFKSDVLFKYALGNDKDADSYYLLKLIIEEICNLRCAKIHVKNPELNPQVIDEKEMILDIRVEDEEGRIFNIEMQNSYLSLQQYYRFQVYSARILSDQVEPGNDYAEVKPVYQIIFIDDIDDRNIKLIDEYMFRNKEADIQKGNLITRIFVYLPNINIQKEVKGLERFSKLELAIYIFKNEVDNAIMEIEDRVVRIMKEKAENFNQNKELRDLAYKRALYKMTMEGEARERETIARSEGIALGESKGLARGRIEGKVETMYKMVEKLFTHQFPQESVEFLKGLSLHQYEHIIDRLMDNASLEEIKQEAKV